MDSSERIARRIARAGLASRREAERWIAAGRVRIDGKTILTPALRVTSDTSITVDGISVPPPASPRIWCYHKCRGTIVSRRDPQGRRTIFDQLPLHARHLTTVGRLDYASEGLLLLTNDGALARFLALPRYGFPRCYRVDVQGIIRDCIITELAQGLILKGIRYRPAHTRLITQDHNRAKLAMTLTEGRYREIRTLLRHFDLRVTRLIRTHFGPFQLGDLPAGSLAPAPRMLMRPLLTQMSRSSTQAI